MTNNDLLIRLRYALDIKDTDMVEIFKLGGVEISKEEVMQMLIKSKRIEDGENQVEENPNRLHCTNRMLEHFLNGFIIFKRGEKETTDAQSEKPKLMIKENANVNNIVLKKLKIALSLTSEDVMDVLEEAGVFLTKGELSALFRKEGHRNYVECGDRYIRNFLKGLTIKYRGE